MPSADILRHVRLFDELDDADLALVAGASRRLRFPKGSVVFQEGDPGDFLLVVEKGRAKVTLLGDDGRETILAMLEPPALLGEIALLDQSPRSATVIAVQATQFLQITRGSFLALIKQHPALALKMMAGLARGLRKVTEQVRSLAMFDVPGRLLRALLVLAQENGETSRTRMVIRPFPSKKDLALMCGCTREAASRAMKDLTALGYVTKLPEGLAVEAKAIRKYLQPTLEHLVASRPPTIRRGL